MAYLRREGRAAGPAAALSRSDQGLGVQALLAVHSEKNG